MSNYQTICFHWLINILHASKYYPVSLIKFFNLGRILWFCFMIAYASIDIYTFADSHDNLFMLLRLYCDKFLILYFLFVFILWVTKSYFLHQCSYNFTVITFYHLCIMYFQPHFNLCIFVYNSKSMQFSNTWYCFRDNINIQVSVLL